MCKQATRTYLFMQFMTAFASSIIFTTFSIYYVTELGFSPLQMVLIGTVLELTVLLFEGITGVVADTFSRKWSVIIGMFILGTGFAIEGCAVWLTALMPHLPAFGIILGAQLFFGIGWTFISGADTAWIIDETGDETADGLFLRAKRLGLAASLLGIAISVLLSTWLPNMPYLAGSLIYWLLGAVLIGSMRETGFAPRPREERETPLRSMFTTWRAGLTVVSGSPLLLALVAVTLVGGAASEGYDRLWQSLFLKDIGFSGDGLPVAFWFGLIEAATVICGMAGLYAAEKFVDLRSARSMSAAMFLMMGVRIAAVLLLAFAPSFGWAAAGVLVAGLSVTVSGPIYTTWLNRNLESGTRATVLSMVSQSDALGQTAGGPAVGWIGSRISLRAALTAAGLLLLPTLGIFGSDMLKPRPDSGVEQHSNT